MCALKIHDAAFVTAAASLTQCPQEQYPEFAFIGRSNVGKSSLINRLLERKSLAKTSSTPGKTKTINHFLVNAMRHPWYLVDLPGFGYARVSQAERAKWQQHIRGYLKERKTLYCTFVLIDARVEPQKIDLEFLEWAAGAGIPFVVVFTKADKCKPAALKRNVEAFATALSAIFEYLPNFIITSSADGTGREQLLGMIERQLKG